MEVSSIVDNVISSPLCIAARDGEDAVVRHLLEKGHHVNLNDNRGWTPLHEAVAHGHIGCVRLLLQSDECDEGARTYEGMTAMYVACQFQNNVELIKLLVDHGVSCNVGNLEDDTPLHIASKFYKLDVIKELVKCGASVNTVNFNQYTPLMEAIEQISTVQNREHETALEVVRFLLDSGTNLSLTDFYGRTHLHFAVGEGWTECTRLLLNYGSNVHARTVDGYSAIFDAARIGNLSLIKLLLEHGASAGVICSNGTMPLHLAIHNGHISVVQELLKRQNSADISGPQKMMKLKSFLILAIDSGSFECFKIIMNHKMFSSVDSSPFTTMDDNILVGKICCEHYKKQSPISFLLTYHLEDPNAMAMLKILHESGEFDMNTMNQDYVPPLVAVIAASVATNSDIARIKKECFLKLLDMGANIDYYSVNGIPGNLKIPDAVLAVIIPRKCNISQNLLLPVLAHCFACNWDDLFDWLVQYQTCNAAVLQILIKLGNKSKQSLIQAWETLKYCGCSSCENENTNIQKLMDGKDTTLQSLSRAKVRQWLWQKTGRSSKAEKLLYDKKIPMPVIQYLVPETLFPIS